MAITQNKIEKALRYYIAPVPKTYVGYKAMIIEKLVGLVGNDGQELFVDVYGTEESQPEGYPVAFVLERVGKGQIIDTHRNEREWQFSIVIHQSISKKSSEEAYVALLDAVDRVIKSFDEDPQFEKNGVGRCKFVRVVPLEFEYAQRETAVHRALVVVAVVDLVNRYLAP